MGEQHKDRRAEYAHPNIERRPQRKVSIKPTEFAAFTRGIHGCTPAAVDQSGNVKQGKQAADHEQAKLHGIGPHHRLEAAN